MSEAMGLFLGSGAFISMPTADIAGMPDATFVSRESLRSGRARMKKRDDGQYNELEGSPEVVLEIITPGSVHKDTLVLRQAYWEAGVREYWLVDPSGKSPRFDILRHTAKGFSATRPRGGWLHSAVFGKAFRLTKAKDEVGLPEFTLAVR
jgi:Uma2 family endonuclease